MKPESDESENPAAETPDSPDHAPDAEGPAEPVALPRKFQAPDGRGEYVYKRRGVFGRTRAWAAHYHRLWLEQSMPKDEDVPLDEDSLTYRLTGTPIRKVLTLVGALIGAVLVFLLLRWGLPALPVGLTHTWWIGG